MKFTVLTLFPEMFAPLEASILKRAQQDGKIEIEIVDLRAYTEDKHQKCDDYPFGGGAGMVMMAQPIVSAIEGVDPGHGARRIYLSPKGRTLSQERAIALSEEEHLVLLCGHYEGVDQRAIDLAIDEEISIGDYVLTGGELPAMVLIDCVSRYAEGVLAPASLVDESFSDGLLEYPQYTRPVVFRGLSVPEVLRSGNHAEIDKWRREQAAALTARLRPDLLKHGKEGPSEPNGNET